MRRLVWCLGLLFLPCLVESSAAAEPGCRSLGRELQCTRCAAIPCCCPDDYCRKPLPCIPCLVLRGCPDDTCRKPQPCLPYFCIARCPDDYCSKPLPHCFWSAAKQFYRCPPCPCEANCLGGKRHTGVVLEPFDRLPLPRCGIFDGLCLVEYNQSPRHIEQPWLAQEHGYLQVLGAAEIREYVTQPFAGTDK